MKEYDLVLLLGGTGSRMKDKPDGNKHLVDVNGKTVVEYIKDKVDAYESQVSPFANKYVVTNGKGVESIMNTLGQGYTYFFQQNPTGVPDAAKIPNPKNPFLLHLGDQFYEQPLKDFINDYPIFKTWLKETKDTNHTVGLLDGDYNFKRFIEKPNYPDEMSAYVGTGIYMLDPSVLNLVSKLPRHEKGENNMSDLGNLVNETNINGVKFDIMKGYWYDIGSQDIRNNAIKEVKYGN